MFSSLLRCRHIVKFSPNKTNFFVAFVLVFIERLQVKEQIFRLSRIKTFDFKVTYPD